MFHEEGRRHQTGRGSTRHEGGFSFHLRGPPLRGARSTRAHYPSRGEGAQRHARTFTPNQSFRFVDPFGAKPEDEHRRRVRHIHPDRRTATQPQPAVPASTFAEVRASDASSFPLSVRCRTSGHLDQVRTSDARHRAGQMAPTTYHRADHRRTRHRRRPAQATTTSTRTRSRRLPRIPGLVKGKIRDDQQRRRHTRRRYRARRTTQNTCRRLATSVHRSRPRNRCNPSGSHR